MKKLLTLLLTLTLIFSVTSAFTACGENDDTPIRVGYLTGPTGMGMAKLIHDNGGADNGNEKYSFTSFAGNAKNAEAALTAGNVDLICVPTNEAAAYFNTTDQNITVLSLNTLGSLYLVTKGVEINSLDDLEGKTIYTCKNGTPRIIIDALLEKAGVNATVSDTVNGTVIDTPDKIAPQIIGGKVDIAVAPEPMVSTALGKNTNYSVALDLAQEWKTEYGTDLAMGCIVANKTFVEEHTSVINRFLDEYKASIEFVSNSQNIDASADYIMEAKILTDINVAKAALANLGDSIAYVDGENMKNILKAFYTAIGITSPDDNFYYEK